MANENFAAPEQTHDAEFAGELGAGVDMWRIAQDVVDGHFMRNNYAHLDLRENRDPRSADGGLGVMIRCIMNEFNETMRIRMHNESVITRHFLEFLIMSWQKNPSRRIPVASGSAVAFVIARTAQAVLDAYVRPVPDVIDAPLGCNQRIMHKNRLIPQKKQSLRR